MDVLTQLLGPSDQLKDAPKVDAENDNLFQSFIDGHQTFLKINPTLVDTTDLSKELDTLDVKDSQIAEAIDDVIPELQKYLNNFNAQLSDFTTELDFIRHKSNELKSLLESNSKKLSEISPLVNDLIIPPKIITSIVHDKLSSSWQDNITFIKDKEEIYAKYKDERSKRDSENGVSDILPKDFDNLCELLEILKLVILERSKKFIVSRIKILRSGKPVPSQRVQRQLLVVKDIYGFLIENNYSLALEIRQAYAYTMKWYYKEYFGRYIRSLTILQFKSVDTQYSLGNVLINASNANGNASYASTLFTSYLGSSFATTVTNDMINSYFQIMKRLTILTQEDNTVMVSQIAEHNNNENFIEIGFKNLNLAILDNFTVEFNFMKNFFQVSDNIDEIHGLMEQIFQPTFAKALEYSETVLLNSYVYDIFGVLISIRIANQLIIESRKRNTNTVEGYMEDQLMLLWPKFQQLIDFQADSLSAIDVSQIALKKDTLYTSPNELAVSFTYFLQSLLILTTSTAPDKKEKNDDSTSMIDDEQSTATQTNEETTVDDSSEPLYNSIIRLRNDFETIMTKFSKTVDSPEKFLSVNYMHLYNMLQQQSLSLAENNDLYSQSSDNSILKDTEMHYKTLVEAFNKQ